MDVLTNKPDDKVGPCITVTEDNISLINTKQLKLTISGVAIDGDTTIKGNVKVEG